MRKPKHRNHFPRLLLIIQKVQKLLFSFETSFSLVGLACTARPEVGNQSNLLTFTDEDYNYILVQLQQARDDLETAQREFNLAEDNRQNGRLALGRLNICGVVG